MTRRNRTILAIAAWWALIALVLLLSGCKTTEPQKQPPQVIEVVVTKYVPVPADLAADCMNEAPRSQTYQEAKRLAIKRGEYLAECTERMRRIQGLGRASVD